MTVQTTISAAAQVHHLRFAHHAMKRLIADIPVEKMCAQPLAGVTMNHSLWIIGHIACTDDYFMREFSGRPMTLPERWHTIFGMGSTPTSDASQYPGADVVIAALNDRRHAYIAWYESLTDQQRAQPAPERWLRFAPTNGDVAYFLTWHRGFHSGQLSTLRRALGLPPALK